MGAQYAAKPARPGVRGLRRQARAMPHAAYSERVAHAEMQQRREAQLAQRGVHRLLAE